MSIISANLYNRLRHVTFPNNLLRQVVAPLHEEIGVSAVTPESQHLLQNPPHSFTNKIPDKILLQPSEEIWYKFPDTND